MDDDILSIFSPRTPSRQRSKDQSLRTPDSGEVYGLQWSESTDSSESLRTSMVRVYGLQQGKSTDFSQVSVSLRTPGKCLLFLGANIYKLTFILNPPSSSSSRHRRCQAMATNKDNDRRARRERGRDYERRRDDDKKK